MHAPPGISNGGSLPLMKKLDSGITKIGMTVGLDIEVVSMTIGISMLFHRRGSPSPHEHHGSPLYPQA